MRKTSSSLKKNCDPNPLHFIQKKRGARAVFNIPGRVESDLSLPLLPRDLPTCETRSIRAAVICQ